MIQRIMEVFLAVVFLTGGYFAVLQMVFKRMQGQRGRGAAALILFLLFFICGGAFFLVAQAMGSMGTVLFFLFMAVSTAAFGGFFLFLASHFRQVRKGQLILMLAYILAVLYITLFSRLGGFNDSVKLELFGTLREAVRDGSVEPMRHLLLNSAMFVPLGILFPMVEPKRLTGAGYVLAAGMVLSTFIESAQMFWQIGQCDIDDIIGNTLGALAGFVIYRLFIRRFYENFDD